MKDPARILILACIILLPLSTAGASGRTESLSKLSMHRIEGSVTEHLGSRDDLSLGSIAADIIITKDAKADYVSAFLTGYAYRSISLEKESTAGLLSIHTDWHGETSIITKELTLEIHIPEDYTGNLFVQTTSGSIIVPSGELEDLEVSSVSGAISFSDITSESIHVRSVSGSIDVRTCHADDITLKSSSGNISFSGSAQEDLSCISISGRIQAEGTAGTITGTSTSGSFAMRISGPFREAMVSTVSGNIEITIPEDIPVQGSVSSVSGIQQIDLSEAVIRTENKNSRFTRGSAPALMSLASVSGRISISDR